MMTAWIIVGVTIAFVEVVLWMVFRHKIEGLCFPRELDQSIFRFFTLTRLRLIAILHTLFLIATFMICSSFLW